MTHYGKIKSYDSVKGEGMINPEKGGDALPFKKADLQQEAQAPRVDQRYGYETSEVDGGSKCATKLQQEGQESGKSQQGDDRDRKGQAGKQQG